MCNGVSVQRGPGVGGGGSARKEAGGGVGKNSGGRLGGKERGERAKSGGVQGGGASVQIERRVCKERAERACRGGGPGSARGGVGVCKGAGECAKGQVSVQGLAGSVHSWR